MNKKNVMMFMLLLLSATSIIQGMCSTSCNICSHTTFVPRTMAQNSVLELALHNYYSYNVPECCECPPWVSVEVTAPYYFKSNKPSQLAEYFLPGCQQCVTVGQNNTSDISSLWLGIAAPLATPYEAQLCLKPKREVIGGAFRLFFDFSAWGNDDCCYNNFWLSIFVPFEEVRHRLDITATVLPGSGAPIVPPSFPDLISALNNPAWLYGKLSPNTLRKRGVDDISVKLGYELFKENDQHADLYALLFIPTGRGTQAHYLFEPLVGSNHVGAGLGVNADYQVYACDNSSVDLMLDARYAYFFKHKEVRSIDLFNGDWSRYLLVVTPTATATPLPGINFFTKEVEVTPRSMFEVWAAASFNYCNWHFEVGYDFWYRAKEKIQLPDQDLGVGILDIAFNPFIQCPISAHCAKICQAVPTLSDAPVHDTTFTSVVSSEAVSKNGSSPNGATCTGASCSNVCSYLNLNSAANPRSLSSTVYGALSFEGCSCGYPVLVGIGGQYEIAHRKSALSQYGVWLKTAISF